MPVSQVQVAAAASAVTGAPLHVATPMAPYISHYPQAHPQTFQGPYAHMVKISFFYFYLECNVLISDMLFKMTSIY